MKAETLARRLEVKRRKCFDELRWNGYPQEV